MKNYRIGIRIHKNDWGFGKHRQIDWLIGGEIKKEDVLFIIENDIPASYKNGFIERGYNYVEILPYKHTLIRALLFFPKWLWFLSHYKIRHYVAYNSFEWWHRSKIWLMKKNGITTWCYMHSRNFLDLYQDNSFEAPVAKMNYDYYVGWCLKEFWLKKCNKRMEFIDVGLIWQ